ncbi:MAG: ferritin-like domain-containing protein [Thermodesulfobacteriota bacterium]
MGLFFNVDEILQMAEQIERNGSAFYRKAAAISASSRSAQFFLKLAAMEDEHEKIFAHMRNNLREEERRISIPDPENQAQAYLKAWADGHVFDVRGNPAEKLSGQEKPEEILRWAINQEKESIVFYLGMKEAVPERLGKKKVDDIIREEMAHIAILNKELETMRHQML